jgi:hypothetical protein
LCGWWPIRFFGLTYNPATHAIPRVGASCPETSHLADRLNMTGITICAPSTKRTRLRVRHGRLSIPGCESWSSVNDAVLAPSLSGPSPLGCLKVPKYQAFLEPTQPCHLFRSRRVKLARRENLCLHRRRAVRLKHRCASRRGGEDATQRNHIIAAVYKRPGSFSNILSISRFGNTRISARFWCAIAFSRTLCSLPRTAA